MAFAVIGTETLQPAFIGRVDGLLPGEEAEPLEKRFCELHGFAPEGVNGYRKPAASGGTMARSGPFRAGRGDFVATFPCPLAVPEQGPARRIA